MTTKAEKAAIEAAELKNMTFVRPVLFGYVAYGPVRHYEADAEPSSTEVEVATEPKMK